ncbi:MAG: hypothetical protein Q9176_007306 [Flavoplaca citrina]
MANVKENAVQNESALTRLSSIPDTQGITKYNMYYTTSRMNVTLHKGHASAPAVFYGHTDCSLTKAHFCLRRGDAKTSPMVAFAKVFMTSRHMQLGRGDYHKQQETSNQFALDDLRRAKNLFCRSDYQFSTAQGSNNPDKKAEFDWRKDRSKIAKTVYECCDSNGRTVAKMSSGGAFNWSKGGEIEVADDLDAGSTEMMLMSALAIWFMEALAYQSIFRGYASGKEDSSSMSKEA